MADPRSRKSTPALRIGIDFDNTIIAYDDVFLAAAKARGLLAKSFQGNKKMVRDAIQLQSGGELAWQALQGYVYGQGIGSATLQPGVDQFIRHCRTAGCAVIIISHKTEFGHHDSSGVNLRDAAIAWMTDKGFFSSDGFGLARSSVVFAGTREAKLAEIARQRCTHFIDDLEEVLSDPAFPTGVERILFAIDDGPPSSLARYIACATWNEIERYVINPASTGSLEELAEHLVGGQINLIEKVGGGRNSRVYRVESAGRVFALKRYPDAVNDPRDRLGAEIDALTVMERHGFEAMPRLIAHDRRGHTALLQWIDGGAITEVSPVDVDEAAVFLKKLHRLGPEPEFPADRLASEACLSGAEIERQIKARLAELERLFDETDLQRFLRDTFHPAVERTLLAAKEEAHAAGYDFRAILPQEKRSLVPSDFGFHNALRRPDGSLVFIDFEYFGWDDPVKLVADVLLHPGTPVGEVERLRFRRAALEIYGKDPSFASRLSALQPLFALRWVLILLNEFVPQRWEQRVSAGDRRSWHRAKANQLERAALLLRESDDVNALVRYA